MLSLTGPDEVEAHVGRGLGVSELQLLTRENTDAFARVTGEDQVIHVDVGGDAQTPSSETTVGRNCRPSLGRTSRRGARRRRSRNRLRRARRSSATA